MMDDHETHVLLGEVRGKLSAIQQQLEGNESEAAKSRDALYDQISNARKEVQEIRSRTVALEAVMQEEVRPAVRMIRDWRSRALGGMAVLGVIGTLILIILGAAKEAIVDLVRAIIAR